MFQVLEHAALAFLLRCLHVAVICNSPPAPPLFIQALGPAAGYSCNVAPPLFIQALGPAADLASRFEASTEQLHQAVADFEHQASPFFLTVY